MYQRDKQRTRLYLFLSLSLIHTQMYIHSVDINTYTLYMYVSVHGYKDSTTLMEQGWRRGQGKGCF